MANRLDYELLNNSLQNLGNTFQRNRQETDQRDLALQRIALEQQVQQSAQARAQASEASNERRERAQQGYFDKSLAMQAGRNKVQDDANAIKDAQEKSKEAQAAFKEMIDTQKQFMGTLKNARLENLQDPDKGLSHDAAVSIFNKHIQGMPQEAAQKMLQDPTISAMADGDVDFTAFGSPQAQTQTLPNGQVGIVQPDGHVTLGAKPAAAKPLPPTKTVIGPNPITQQMQTNTTSYTPSPFTPQQPSPATQAPGAGLPPAYDPNDPMGLRK